jgi:hypothetical protein
MKKECRNCFYHIHITKDPFCYKFFKSNPSPCDEFKKRSCSDCLHGKDFNECQLKKKDFPKKDYCNDFERYERWAFDE